ncbi:MAG: 2OG-Fe dioxygenase family protein [Hyphomicrobiaceae bacterium]|nr:2OG-Fe dioxygenase family protein [Hyphomicrobiaceae bacterium]
MADIMPAPRGAFDGVLARSGSVFVRGADMRAMLEATGSLADWDAFAASWGDLELDTYMADGGRYRRRRHAVYEASPGGPIVRQPHQPHYQTLDYNPLNGGLDRWFAPVVEPIGAGSSLTTILSFCNRLFSGLSPTVARWKAEIHQFRIEAGLDITGKPTPEGMHRDGVDWVLVLLIRRQNIRSGTTTIADLSQRPMGSFTLTDQFDSALVDDSRVYHGVTPIEPIDAAAPAWRDVLVVTFAKS